jgi:4-amino-4-deoxy-L-arabinose transferase-like glycosyltransferase
LDVTSGQFALKLDAGMFSSRPDRLRIAVLLALAVTIRLLYVASTPRESATASVDGWGYHRLAVNLEQGNGFSLHAEPPFIPDSIRTPLYPAFLWLVRQAFGTGPRVASIVQAVLDGGTTLLTAWLAAQLAGPRAGRVAGLLYALNPTQVRYVNDALTETLLAFLLTGSVCLLARYLVPADRQASRRTWLLGAAVLAGLAVLCKPNVQYLPLLWLPALVLRRQGRSLGTRLVDGALLIAVVAGILTPWVVRNQIVFGRPFVSTAFEGNVSRVSAPATLAMANRQYVMPWSTEWEGFFGQVVADAAREYGWDKTWETLTARELDLYNHQLYLTARGVLFRAPGAWIASHLQGLGRYLEPQTYRVCYRRFAGRPWPPDVLDDAAILSLRALVTGRPVQAGEILAWERWIRIDPFQRLVWWGTLAGQVIGLGLMGCGVWRLRHRPALVLLLLATIGYVLWMPGPIAYERFRVPVTGLILALVAVAGVGGQRARVRARDGAGRA